MFKRRTLINKLNIYNLESIIVSFPDQEKLLKNVDSGQLALSMNANTKNPQIEYCPFQKYGRPDS